jgi:hypothetical protein
MSKILDGPAAGAFLSLGRSPYFLRVVRKPGGKWDALDQLDDTPEPDEEIHVYRQKQGPMAELVRRSRSADFSAGSPAPGPMTAPLINLLPSIAMPQKLVKCTTCRDIHPESARLSRRNRKEGFFTLVCPACGGKIHWMILKNPIKRRRIAKSSEEWEASYADDSEAEHIERIAKDCGYGATGPCDGCLAGGLCDADTHKAFHQ